MKNLDHPNVTAHALGELDPQQEHLLRMTFHDPSSQAALASEREEILDVACRLRRAFAAEAPLRLTDDQRESLLASLEHPPATHPAPPRRRLWRTAWLTTVLTAGAAAAVIALLSTFKVSPQDAAPPEQPREVTVRFTQSKPQSKPGAPSPRSKPDHFLSPPATRFQPKSPHQELSIKPPTPQGDFQLPETNLFKDVSTPGQVQNLAETFSDIPLPEKDPTPLGPKGTNESERVAAPKPKDTKEPYPLPPEPVKD